MTLRKDPRGWLIYERGPVEATVRALEVAALGIVGRRLASHPNLSVRAIGNVMAKLAAGRLRCGLGLVPGVPTTEDRRLALQWAMKVTGWALDGGEAPLSELDELHGVVFHLDSRLNSAGLSGPGWERDLGRGD